MTDTLQEVTMIDSSLQNIFLGRQPILDRQQQMFAYELLFRSAGYEAGNHADFQDASLATATVITNAFSEFSMAEALGPYRGFIKIDRELLFSDLIEALPPKRVRFELLGSIRPDDEVIRRCHGLLERGFSLAVNISPQLDESFESLMPLVEIIKVDLRAVGKSIPEDFVARLRRFGKKLLAEKVETPEQKQRSQELGFDLFQGYHFARPTVISGKKLNPSQLSLVRLLGLILEDADTSALENAFKLEPGLTVNMLRLTNSVSCGLSTRITSLRHAITILGRRQLQRWLQLLMYANASDAVHSVNPLLQLAATRGRLMELLTERTQAGNRESAEQAFMIGIMSLMPALLGVTMNDILAQLPVAPRVKQALSEHTGMHGQLLRLVESSEAGASALQEALAQCPSVNPMVFGECLTHALGWANNLGREREAE